MPVSFVISTSPRRRHRCQLARVSAPKRATVAAAAFERGLPCFVGMLLLAVTARVGMSPGTARVGLRLLAPAPDRAGYALSTTALSFWDEEASVAQRSEDLASLEQEVPETLTSPALGVPAISWPPALPATSC